MNTQVIAVIRSFDTSNEAPLCSSCGGRCCKTMPGSIFPADLSPSLNRAELLEKTVSALRTGRYALDCWEGDPRDNPEVRVPQALYLRPAVAGNEGRTFHASWGGACTFHSDKGCELAFAQRPTECRALQPRLSAAGKPHCELPDDSLSKRGAAIAWLPFTIVLKKAQRMADLLAEA